MAISTILSLRFSAESPRRSAQQPKAEAKKDAVKSDEGPKATIHAHRPHREAIADSTTTRALDWFGGVVRKSTDPKTKMPVRTETEIDARAEAEYAVPDEGSGKYTVTLEIWTTAKAGRNKDGYHTAADARTSKFIPIAAPVVLAASGTADGAVPPKSDSPDAKK